MILFANDLLLQLGRTTLALSVAVLLTGLLLRLARVTSPTIHRTACLLALAVGWSFLQWPLSIPWYVAAPQAEQFSAQEMAGGLTSVGTPLQGSHELLADNDEGHWSIAIDEVDSPVASVGTELIPSPTDETMAPPTVAIEDVSADDAVHILWTERVAILTLAAWVLGIALLSLAWIVGYVRFVFRLPAPELADEAWQLEWQDRLDARGIRQNIPLRVTADAGPMLCRLPRGYELLVPGPLWRELGEAERAAILRHELAHFERGDVWKSLAARVLALPHWFNPLTWWAVRRYDEAAEWACDLAATGETSTTMYARALVRLGETAGSHASYSPAARGRPLAARVRRLLATRNREDSRIKKGLLIAACLCFTVSSLLRVELVAQEPGAAAAKIQSEVVDPQNLQEAAEVNPHDTLELRIAGPQSASEGEKAAFTISLKNSAADALVEVKVVVALDDALKAVIATEGHTYEGDNLAWRVDSLPPDKTVRWIIECRCEAPSPKSSVVATVTVDGTKSVESAAHLAIAPAGTKMPAPQETVTVVPHYPDVIKFGEHGFKAASAAYNADTITLDEVCDWSLRWLAAEESTERTVHTVRKEGNKESDEETVRLPTDVERILAVRAHLARMKQLQTRIDALNKAGTRGGEEEKKALMGYYVADAERRLARLLDHRTAEQRKTAALKGLDHSVGPQDDPQPAPQPTVPPGVVKQMEAFRARNALRYDGRSFAEWVDQLDTELSTERRQAAITALAAFGTRGYGPEATKKLVELLPDAELQRDAIRGLERIGPPAAEALPALEKLAKTPDLRPAALTAMARVRGEHVDAVSANELRARREGQLQETLTRKNEQLIRDMRDVENLQRSLGVFDPASAATQSLMLQQQLLTVNNSIYNCRSQLTNLEVEIDKIQLDLALAQDPSAKEARVEEEIQKDEKLKTLEEQKSDLQLALGGAVKIPNADDPVVKRFEKTLASVNEKITLRRDELTKRFADSNETVRVKEYQGKLAAAKKHRDSVAKQLEDLTNQSQELTERLKLIARDVPELESKRQRVKTLQQIVDEIARELHKIAIEKQQAKEASQLQESALQPFSAAVQPPQPPATRVGTTVVADDGRVVAYIKLARQPAVRQAGATEPDSYEFLTFRNTTIELLRSKSLLTRVLRASVEHLPLIKEQPDPVQWLQDNLAVKCPNDADLVEIAMTGKDKKQLVEIVNAVVDTYFKEVVDKGNDDRQKREAKLKELHARMTAELEQKRELVKSLEQQLEKLEPKKLTPQARLLEKK